MSLILYVYFSIVLLFNFASIICDQTSDRDYEVDNKQESLGDSSHFLENRVDLNYDTYIDDASTNVDDNNEYSQAAEQGGIIDKLKGVWNKLLHPNKYDSATYTDTLNNFHDEIFKFLNEDKVPRSLQPVNLQCQTTCNSSNSQTKQNQTSTLVGSTVKQNETATPPVTKGGQVPSGQTTTDKPSDQTPPGKPPSPAPSGKPPGQTPPGKPPGQTSPGKPPGEAPSGKPPGEASSGKPPDQAPSSKPSDELPACTTYLNNFTVDQLNYLKKFLKCMQLQQENLDKKSNNTDSKKPAPCPTCGDKSKEANITSTSVTKKPPTAKAASSKAKSKPKVESGKHAHELNKPPINHTALEADNTLLSSYNIYLNKLQFLAHLHHTVCQVGQKKLQPIDLNLVQKLIDEAKSKLQIANESLSTCKAREDITVVKPTNPDIMFPFFNPYYTRKKRNFRGTDSDINDVVSMVQQQLKNSNSDTNSGVSEYSKILGVRKSKKKKKKKKKRKGRKKNTKKLRESEDGAETAGKMPMNVNISNSIYNNFNADYNNLKFKVSPEQEEDINKFLKNINERPQLFSFDIEQYLNPNVVKPVRNPPSKIKSYFEFNTDANEHHSFKRKPGQFFVFKDEVDEQLPDSSIKSKRDILTQRIKAISNKMRMASFLEHPELHFDSSQKISRSSAPYTAPRYSTPLNLDQFKTDNDFVDKFYLLNDGNPNTLDYVEANKESQTNKINSIDLGIDLDLDKKFRDLRWETDRKFYSDMVPNGDVSKKNVDDKNIDASDISKNNDFIFYK